MNALLFPAPRCSYSSEHPRLVTLGGSDFLGMYYCYSDSPARTLMLYLHGNGEDLGQIDDMMQEYSQQLGVDVLSVEYPGYGVATGSPSASSINDAVDCAYEYATNKLDVTPENIVIFGRSIGSGPAASVHPQVRALLLQSAYMSLKDVTAQMNITGASLVSKLMLTRWDSARLISSISAPTLFVHGARDTLIQPSHSESLHRLSASSRKHLVILPDDDHNSLVASRMLPHVAQFLGQHTTAAPLEQLQDMMPELLNDPVEVRDQGEQPEDEGFDMEEILRQRNPRIVIVGAGPIGLFMAIGLAISRGSSDGILVLERYEIYLRSHVLRVVASSLAGAPLILSDTIKSVMSPTGSVRTNALEGALRELASELGIQQIRGVRLSQQHVRQVCCSPSVEWLIGCDGARSTVRQAVFGEVGLRDTLQCVVDFKMEVNSTQAMSTVQQYSTLKLMQHLCTEYVGKVGATGTQPVTVRFLISKEEYLACRREGASFRDPLVIPRDLAALPASLSADLFTWMNVKHHLYGTEVVGPVRVTALDLAVYHSSAYRARVSQGSRSLQVALCGDSALGVPYFRALNAGFISAVHLLRRIPLEGQATEVLRIPTQAIGNPAVFEPAGQPAAAEPAQAVGFFKKVYNASAASLAQSVSMSKNLSNASAQMSKMALSKNLSFQEFQEVLVAKEIANAKVKRDGLALGRLAIVMTSSWPSTIQPISWNSEQRASFAQRNPF